MAIKITRQLLCDYHSFRNEEVEADKTTPPITVGAKGQPLVLDLCAECYDDLVTPLEELLRLEGRNEDGSRPKRKRGPKPKPAPAAETLPDTEAPAEDDGKPHHCPTCGAGFTTPQGVGAHRHRVHGFRREAKKKAS